MASRNSDGPDKTAEAKAEAVVFVLKDPKGREYRTSDEAEATNRIRTQGYKRIK